MIISVVDPLLRMPTDELSRAFGIFRQYSWLVSLLSSFHGPLPCVSKIELVKISNVTVMLNWSFSDVWN